MESKSSIEKILERRRQGLGEAASLEEVFKLHGASTGRIELSERERSQLLEKISADPEAARQLRDLLRFPRHEHVEEDPDALEQQWHEFKRKLSSDLEREAQDENPSDSFDLGDPQPWASRIRRAVPWLSSVAAAFALGLVSAVLLDLPRDQPDNSSPPLGHRDTPATAAALINLAIAELVADGDLSRGAPSIHIPESADGVLLTLATKFTGDEGPFELSIETPSKERLNLQELVPGPGGVFVVTLPRESFEEGLHSLHLIAMEQEDPREASFELRVTLAP